MTVFMITFLIQSLQVARRCQFSSRAEPQQGIISSRCKSLLIAQDGYFEHCVLCRKHDRLCFDNIISLVVVVVDIHVSRLFHFRFTVTACTSNKTPEALWIPPRKLRHLLYIYASSWHYSYGAVRVNIV